MLAYSDVMSWYVIVATRQREEADDKICLLSQVFPAKILPRVRFI